MSKVLQIRDLPDDLHASLTRAAARHGMSLTAYARKELEKAVRLDESMEHNRAVIEASQDTMTSVVTREQILDAIADGRR